MLPYKLTLWLPKIKEEMHGFIGLLVMECSCKLGWNVYCGLPSL